jgi:DNA primase
MARLPTEVINRLKTEVSLVRLLEAQGFDLQKHGQDWVTRCPFHNDKTPSLVISPKTNLWHCLGACNKGGSVIDWVMQTRGVSFRFACEILQNDLGLATDIDPQTKRNTTIRLDSPISDDSDDHAVMAQVIDYYYQCLKDAPEALAYLEERGIADPELIDHFKLGFANRSLGYRLPAKTRKAGKQIRGQLQSLGILRETGHEHFNGSIVVPVFDDNGHVSEIYGRKITKALRP